MCFIDVIWTFVSFNFYMPKKVHNFSYPIQKSWLHHCSGPSPSARLEPVQRYGLFVRIFLTLLPLDLFYSCLFDWLFVWKNLLVQFLDLARSYPPQPEDSAFPKREFVETAGDSTSVAPTMSQAERGSARGSLTPTESRIQKNPILLITRAIRWLGQPFLQSPSLVALLRSSRGAESRVMVLANREWCFLLLFDSLIPSLFCRLIRPVCLGLRTINHLKVWMIAVAFVCNHATMPWKLPRNHLSKTPTIQVVRKLRALLKRNRKSTAKKRSSC
jgi:hypothetical protein